MSRAPHDPRMLPRAESLRAQGWPYLRIARSLSEEFGCTVGQSTVRDWVTYSTRSHDGAAGSDVLLSGFVAVPVDIADKCRHRARAFFDAKAAEHFSGELVDSDPLECVEHLPRAWTLFPWNDLKRFRLRQAAPSSPRSQVQVVTTAGVDPHDDDILGLSLCWVLHNDNLEFRQSGKKIKAKAGEWFVFDDRLTHEVRSAAGRAVFMGVTTGLSAM